MNENKKFLNYVKTITKVNLYTKREFLIYFNDYEDKKVKFFPHDLKNKREKLIKWSKNKVEKIEDFDEIKISQKKTICEQKEIIELRKARYYTKFKECKNCKKILNENYECECKKRCDYCLSTDHIKSNCNRKRNNKRNIFFNKRESSKQIYCLYCNNDTHLNCFYDYTKFNFNNNFIEKNNFNKLFDDFDLLKNIKYYYPKENKKIFFDQNFRISYNNIKFSKYNFLNFCCNELKFDILRETLSNKINKNWKKIIKKIIKFYDMKLDNEIENLNKRKKILIRKEMKKKNKNDNDNNFYPNSSSIKNLNKKKRKNRQLKKYLNSNKFISKEINCNQKNGKYNLKKKQIKIDDKFFVNKFKDERKNNVNKEKSEKKIEYKKERRKKRKKENKNHKKIDERLFEMKFDNIKNFQKLDKNEKSKIEEKISKKINVELNKILKENDIIKKNIELKINFDIPKKKKDKKKYSKENDNKIKIKYYKNLKNITYNSLNNLLKKKCCKNSNKRIFDKVHQNSNNIIFCVYSGELVSKKGKMIQPYNKEHCMPKYTRNRAIYMNSQKNDHFDNNLHNMVPICEEANFLRGSKFFYCPTFNKKENKCFCDSLKVSKNTLGLGREAIFVEEFYSEISEFCLKEIIDNKKDKLKNHKLFEKNEFGYFFLGDPGYFCPKYNIGPVSRACLYSLVKYPGGFNIKRKNKEFLNFIIYKAEHEKVEDWEKMKNFKVFLYQRDRNPFVDYPSWSSKIDFSRAFK